MYAPINQRIRSAGDDEDEERYDVVCKEPPIQIQESSFLSYYNHNFGQPPQHLTPKLTDFACFNATSSNPFKFSYDRLIQEGFDLASPKKKRKSEVADGGDGGGGRVVRATGRKDRHSKVRTARGPRDRRVRLSPTTAIQLYDVQDRLGYDRPSKAIDWLITEAKAAIDALDQQQQSTTAVIKFSESNAAEELPLSLMREKQERRNDVDGLVSGFSGFVDEAAPSAAALEAYLDQYGFCSALNSTPQIFGGGGGAEYCHSNCQAAAQPISGESGLIREPLQSSIINNSSSINNHFAGFHFSSELSKIADSATMKN